MRLHLRHAVRESVYTSYCIVDPNLESVFQYHYCTTSGNPKRERGTVNEATPKTSVAYEHFAWIDALSESNLCVALALPVSEYLRTPSTGKASATH
jgi:hypothetical protein